MPKPRIVRVCARKPRRRAGGKVRGLQVLLQHGLPIPETWVTLWSRRSARRTHTKADGEGLRRRLTDLLDVSGTYAVRSSAEIEDGEHRSQAGRFLTVLRVQGIDRLIDAVKQVLDSGSCRSSLPFVSMGVIIQEMVDAAVSGVVFSRNPVTWADEAIIEAVPGTGEALTQGTSTPLRWAVRGEEVEGDDPLSDLGQEVVIDIAQTARRLAARLGYDIDLEWAFDGRRLFWLQLRPMTGIRPSDVYSNRFSREYLPGLILPLVWEINIPMVNGAWLRLLSGLIGRLDLPPERLAERIGCRAYFNMGLMGNLFARAGLPRDVLESLMGLTPGGVTHRPRPTFRMLRHTPRVIVLWIGALRYPRRWDAWVEGARRRLVAQAERVESTTDPQRLLALLNEMLPWMSELAYHRIATMILHALRHRQARARLRREGLGIDPSEALLPDPRLDPFDPSPALKQLRDRFQALSPQEQRLVVWPPSLEARESRCVRAFLDAFGRFLDAFGYLCDSGNDFSSVRWREVPERILQWVTVPEDSIERDDEKAIHPPQVPRSIRTRLQRLSDARFRREVTGAVFTQAHALLRTLVLKLGDALTDQDCIDTSEDVFYLSIEEIRPVLEGACSEPHLRDQVSARKNEMEIAKDLVLPETIYGDGPPSVDPSPIRGFHRTGVPASRGIHTGPACVVRSSEDFGRLSPGDVLVIPFSDVGWTPLILTASAVVAEAGGMLSHAAIVAREAGIPAVASVPGACTIPEGTLLRVDGTSGVVTWVDPNRSDESVPGAP